MTRDWHCEDPQRRHGWAAAINSTLRVVEGKWKIVIINELMATHGKPLRFSELERFVLGVNQKMLIQQLKELERDGIVLRKVYPEVPPKVEYSLTELGLALGPAMTALVDWAELRCQQQGIAFEPNGHTSLLSTLPNEQTGTSCL